MSSAAPSSGSSMPADFTLTFYHDSSALSSNTELDASDVSQSRGTLKSDKGRRVIHKYVQGNQEFVFVRMPISELKGKTAFDVWVPSKGKFYVFAVAPFENKDKKDLYRMNLESYGNFPEEGAPADKLINVLSNKIWPVELTY